MTHILMRLPAVLACLAALLLGTAAGAQPPPLTLTGQDSGKTVTLTPGQRLTVDLKLAGNVAVVAPEFDLAILILRVQNLQSTSTPQGSSVKLKYEFEARKAGETDLVIPAKTSQERSGPGKPLFKIHVVVTPGRRT